MLDENSTVHICVGPIHDGAGEAKRMGDWGHPHLSGYTARNPARRHGLRFANCAASGELRQTRPPGIQHALLVEQPDDNRAGGLGREL